mgnify:CR=1 FL=1
MVIETLSPSGQSEATSSLSPELQRQLRGIKGAIEFVQCISVFRDDYETRQTDEIYKCAESLQNHIAALVEHVYTQLRADQHPVNITIIKESICTTVLDVAADAKAQGLPLEECALMLQPILFVYASMPDKPTEDIARTIVAHGLAPELIQATEDTLSIVCSEPQKPDEWSTHKVPLSRIANNNNVLFAAAIGKVPKFLNGTIIESPGVNNLDRLSISSLLALYSGAQIEGSKLDPSDVINHALTKITNDIKRFQQPPGDLNTIAAVLSAAKECGLHQELATTAETLRAAFMGQNSSYIEYLVPLLITSGDGEVAKMLLTPGKDCVRDYYRHDPDMIKRIHRLEKEKEQELFELLQSKGMPKDGGYFKKILQATDPLSAIYIPDDFSWQDKPGKPSEEFEHVTIDIPDLTGSLGLRAMQVMYTRMRGTEFVKFAETHNMSLQEQSKYFTEFFTLLTKVTSCNQQIINALLMRDDPNAILRLVDKIGIEELAAEDVEFFSRCSRKDQSVFEAINQISKQIGATAPLEVIKKMLDIGPDSVPVHLAAILKACDMFDITSQDASAVLKLTARVGYNPECLNSLRQIKESSNLTNIQLVEVMSYLVVDYISSPLLQDIIDIQKMLAENGIAIADICNLSFIAVRKCMEEPNSKNKLLHLFSLRQIGDAYLQKNAPLVGENINLSDLELPLQELLRLGFSGEVARQLLDGWFSKRPLRQAIRDSNNNEVSDALIKKSKDALLKHYTNELDSLIRAIDEIGLHDCISVIETFGITHFSTHKPKDLQDQLQRWLAGDPAVKNIVLQGRADWNGAFSKFPQESRDTLMNAGAATDDIIFFEVDSIADVLRTIRKVGIRERKHGREPSVDNVIVGVHGGPTIVRLGDDDISTVDEIEKEIQANGDLLQNLANKHLGDHYIIILYACSVTEKVAEGSNYVQALSILSGRVAHGADRPPHGMTINPDRSVIFGGESVKTKTYKAGVEL